MKQPTTQPTRREASADLIKKHVIQYLGIDELYYAELQYEAGLCYLSLVLKNEYYEGYLQRRRVFWNWWKYQWTIRDVLFLHAAKYSRWIITASGRLRLQTNYPAYAQDYYYLHSPSILASNIHPNGIISQDTYTGIISAIVDLK